MTHSHDCSKSNEFLSPTCFSKGDASLCTGGRNSSLGNTFWRGALEFSVLRFWLFFRSVFRFLLQKTSVFRFWWSLPFADFSFFSIWFSVFVKNTSGFSVLVPDVVFGFWKGSEVQ